MKKTGSYKLLLLALFVLSLGIVCIYLAVGEFESAQLKQQQSQINRAQERAGIIAKQISILLESQHNNIRNWLERKTIDSLASNVQGEIVQLSEQLVKKFTIQNVVIFDAPIDETKVIEEYGYSTLELLLQATDIEKGIAYAEHKAIIQKQGKERYILWVFPIMAMDTDKHLAYFLVSISVDILKKVMNDPQLIAKNDVEIHQLAGNNSVILLESHFAPIATEGEVTFAKESITGSNWQVHVKVQEADILLSAWVMFIAFIAGAIICIIVWLVLLSWYWSKHKQVQQERQYAALREQDSILNEVESKVQHKGEQGEGENEEELLTDLMFTEKNEKNLLVSEFAQDEEKDKEEEALSEDIDEDLLAGLSDAEREELLNHEEFSHMLKSLTDDSDGLMQQNLATDNKEELAESPPDDASYFSDLSYGENQDEVEEQTRYKSYKPKPSNEDSIFANLSLSGEEEEITKNDIADKSVSPTPSSDTKAGLSIPEQLLQADALSGDIEQFKTDLLYALGQSFAAEANEAGSSEIAIGYDAAKVTQNMATTLIDGMKDAGIKVLQLGVVNTSLLFYAALNKAQGFGIMLRLEEQIKQHLSITFVVNGKVLFQEGLKQLNTRIAQQQLPANSAGDIQTLDILDTYIEDVDEKIILARPMKVVIDCMYGVTAHILPKLLEEVGCQVIMLRNEVKNSPPDEVFADIDNIQLLSEKIISQRADVGFALNYSGDRFVIVSSSGDTISMSKVLMLLGEDLLSRVNGANILCDTELATTLAPFIEEKGGKVEVFENFSQIRSQFYLSGAMLAGDSLGHIILSENWASFDDVIFTISRLLEILSEDLRKSRMVFSEYPDK